MTDAFDINDAAAKFAAEMATSTYSKFIKGISNSLALNQQVMQSNLKDYAIQTASIFGYIRTLVSESDSKVLDIYQPAKFRRSTELYSESQLYQFVEINLRAIIRGNAGAGKSLFLRRYYLHLIEKRQSIPILFELRGLNSDYSGLMERLHRHAKSLMPWMEFEVFRTLLKNGKIELLLDGLDEVSHSIRSSVNTDIGMFVNEFPKARLILTTRYGDRYASPSRIEEFHVEKFSKEQAASLVRALDFPYEPKMRFAKELENGLYEKSPGLLSNPLLCSIMLLTYRRFAAVPDQLHIYYQQAYEVLFSRHDAGKENGVDRDLLSGLNVFEMQGVLDYFSALTYASDMFDFSESECLEIISESIVGTNIKAKSADIKDDLIEAVSMLNRDGLELTFVHRSFQEFFCAHYISKSSNDVAKACIEAVKMRDDTDSVIPMTIALNEDRFEEVWLLPSIRQDFARYSEDFKSGKYYNIVRDTLPTVEIVKNDVVLGLGVESRSKSFGIYMRTMDGGADHLQFNGKDVERLFSFSSPKTLLNLISAEALNLPVPKWFREEISNDRVLINTEDRMLSVLSEMTIWKPFAQKILTLMRLWLEDLEGRKQTREAIPMVAFRRAATSRSRRIEGDLSGGIPRMPQEEN